MSRLYYPEARVVVYATFEGTVAVGRGPFGSDLPEPVTAFPAFPMSVEVQRNSYDQADSWSVDFDHKDFPLAPQAIKACAIEIYIYDKGALNVDLASIVGTPSNPLVEPTVSGLCDGVVVEYSGDGRVVTLEGQDYTALFLERTWKTTDRISSAEEARRSTKKSDVGHPAPIPSGRPLDDHLRDLIAEVDVTGRIRLEVRVGAGTTIPVVGAAVSRTVREGFKADRDASYWTVMSKMARLSGFLLFVEGGKVVLTTPTLVFNRLERVYRLRWGRDLTSLRMERQLGKERVPQVEVRCYDDRTMTTLVERFPTADQPATTGIGTSRNERHVHVVYGVRDKVILRRFAQNLYELLGRGEQEIEFQTADMRDQAGLDLLQLRSGDAVMVEFDSLWEEFRNLEPPQILGILISKGYPANVAQFLAENYKRMDSMKAPLYVREARLSWSVDEGVVVEGKLINFVDPTRSDAA